MSDRKVNKFHRLIFIVYLMIRFGWRRALEVSKYLLCSQCFLNEGLRISAEEIGLIDNSVCPNCHAVTGRKLTKDLVQLLSYRFFVWGTFFRTEYGGAPIIQFNDRHEHEGDISENSLWPKTDVQLIENRTNFRFFHYGPRLWMVGSGIEPLEALIDSKRRGKEIQRIIDEYPTLVLDKNQKFYRIRSNPVLSDDISQYDSPQKKQQECGRFDSKNFPVMYASQDLQICIHECRVTADDEVFVATLLPMNNMNFLDLTAIISYNDKSEFESLDMAVHMLFFAGRHSYGICREIAYLAHKNGYDGLVYPSYFSLLRTGKIPFETTYGISHRRFPSLASQEKSKIISNLALFGHPVKKGRVKVQSINKLVLRKVQYDYHFGPVGL